MNTEPSSDSLNSFANDYKLPRNEAEHLRLSSQHYMITRRQGWLIHPKIWQALSSTGENIQIADVACGTAIWTFQAADEYPKNTSITGLDISDAQFPPQWAWPSNATLGIVDLAKPISQEHQARYDLVHCRHLLQAGPDIDPRIWVRNFESLLKPGGWIQWEEANCPSFVRVSGTDNHQVTPIPYPSVDKIMGIEPKSGWFRDFDVWMRENSNLQDVEKIHVPVHPPTIKLENDVIRFLNASMYPRLSQIADLDDSLRVHLKDEMIDQYDRMNKEGDFAAYNWLVDLARAPSG